MVKIRLAIFLATIIVVGSLATIASLYARGYRFDTKTLKFIPSGLLVVNSDPTGAQIFVNAELKTATNATITLSPGTYDLALKKEGFLTWKKRLTVQKETVTQVEVTLFPAAPSLTPLTQAGGVNPVPSADFTKIAYGAKDGLWVAESVNLPIGFPREPRRITDADLTGADWEFSPDSREILLTSQSGIFLLSTGEFTSQARLVNVSDSVKKIKSDWQTTENKKLAAQLSKLPTELQDIFKRKAAEIRFSPDENKILYTASASGTIPEGLIKALPGSSTQKQTRDIELDHQYVYDIREDRNFEVGTPGDIFYWFPTSRELVNPQADKIIIMDYDANNKEVVYSGSYVYPHAYPFDGRNKLVILTNLGSQGSTPNLYFLSLK